MSLLSTNQAAEKLNVTPIRVRQLIREGKITAQKVGRDYAIEESALASVSTYGKAGRPRLTANGSQTPRIDKEESFKTAFDLAPDLMNRLCGKYDSGVTDLASNKNHLKDLSKKNAEKEGLRKRG
jgi:excisionase family DNA binding protein